jgi:hypothetical protein
MLRAVDLLEDENFRDAGPVKAAGFTPAPAQPGFAP